MAYSIGVAWNWVVWKWGGGGSDTELGGTIVQHDFLLVGNDTLKNYTFIRLENFSRLSCL